MPSLRNYTTPCRIFVDAMSSCRNQKKAVPVLTMRTASFASYIVHGNKQSLAPENNRIYVSRKFTIWSDSISFTSPEADFTGRGLTVKEVQTLQTKKAFIDFVQKNERARDDTAYTLSHASTGSDFVNPIFMDLLDDRMKHQLQNIDPPLKQEFALSRDVNAREISTIENRRSVGKPEEEERRSPLFDRQIFHEEPIPRSLQEAYALDDSRAIVITEATMPFRIVSVNHSWEKLCGYTQNECKGMTLLCIQGDETDGCAVTALMAQLLKGEEAGTLLTNYTKTGRKFHNRLRVGPLKNKDDKITHFVGVLKEVNEVGEYFNGSVMHE